MATDVCTPQCPNLFFKCEPDQGAKVLPQTAFYEPFRHTTHSTIQVCDDSPGSPQPTSWTIPVNVFDASNGTSMPFLLKSTDTVDKLTKKYLKMKPELGGRLNLAYNGKPVQALKTLGELGVKAGAMFITFQKCTGG